MDFSTGIEQRKSHLVQGFSLTLVALSMMFAAIRLLSQTGRPIMLPTVMLIIAVCGWCFFQSRYRNNTFPAACVLVSVLTLALLGVSFINGGFTAPMFVLLPLSPLLATMMIGPRAGLVAMAVLGFILTGMMVLHGSGYEFPVGPLLSANREILRGFTVLIGVVLIGAAAWHYATETETLSAAIYQQATHDYLTGLLNRRALDAALESEIDRAGRGGGWLSLIIADVDHFKDFNDRYGHIAGDQVLKIVAEKLQGRFRRSTDSVGRWGGEEFAIILPATGPKEAERLANLLREEVAALDLTMARGGSPTVTITLGIGSIKERRRIEVDELLELADNALYRGKEQGRNQVAVSVMRGQQPQLRALDFSAAQEQRQSEKNS